MLYLLTHYWIWLAVAFVVGAATPLLADKFGWAADLEDYWLQRVGLVLAVALVLIVARLASGRMELLLETGAGLFIAYVIGGLAGGFSAGLLPARFEGWWVGLFATALILLLFGITTLRKIEPELREQVAEVVKGAGVDPVDFDVAGRDVLLPVDVGNETVRATLSQQILAVPGVRLVTEVEDLTGAALAAKTVAKLKAEAEAKADAEAKAAAAKAAEQASKEAATKAAKDAAVKQAAAKARADAEAKEVAAKAAAEAAAKEAAAKEAASKAAAEAAAKDAAAKDAAAKAAAEEAAKRTAGQPAEVKTANAAGAVAIPEAQACQSKVSAIAAAQKINFERGSAEIDQASQPVLTKLAAAIAQCPAVTIEVAGHTDGNGKKAANEALSMRRAEAVVASLTKTGIGAAKLTAAGYGSAKPIAGNDTPEGRAQNRRIEFVVK